LRFGNSNRSPVLDRGGPTSVVAAWISEDPVREDDEGFVIVPEVAVPTADTIERRLQVACQPVGIRVGGLEVDERPGSRWRRI
jgi:hypothetical protein